MNAAQLRKVNAGDIVKCNLGGRVFLATASRPDTRDGVNGLVIDPIPGKGSKVSQHWASGADITEHYAKVAL